MPFSRLSYYTHKVTSLQKEWNKHKSISNKLFYARLLTFALFLGFLVAYIVLKTGTPLLVVSAFSLLLFLLVVQLDFKNLRIQQELNTRLTINQQELQYLAHNYQGFSTGSEFEQLNPNLSADFDLFGQKSLFQFINRCSTRIGTKRLAQTLVASNVNNQDILKRQEAITELSNNRLLLEDLQMLGTLSNDKEKGVGQVEAWLEENESVPSYIGWLLKVIIAGNVVVLSLVFGGLLPFNALTVAYFFGLFVAALFSKRIGVAQRRLDKTAKVFKKYALLIKLIETVEFKAELLNEIKASFSQHGKASEALNVLFKLLDRFDLRANLLFMGFVNPFILLDVRIYLALLNWRKTHSGSVKQWFNALAEIDSLVSFAVYAFNSKDEVVYPEIITEGFAIDAQELGHPLISSSKRVCNSVVLGGSPSVTIITGANMAGKSTFLRTLGINLILAQCGAPVCALRMAFTPMHLKSSLKIEDSLADNQSYFYAELLRLKNIIDFVAIHPNTFIILDEILRGTNTKDKQLGSIGLLENMVALNTHVIIATHDLVIGEMEKTYPEAVQNFCFEVELVNDQLCFDYKLKQGITKKLNASFLMKKMGIFRADVGVLN